MKNALLIFLVFLGFSAQAQTITITNAGFGDVWVKIYYNNPSSITCPYDCISKAIHIAPTTTTPIYDITTLIWASGTPSLGGEFLAYEVYDYDPTPNSCCISCTYPQGQLIGIVGDPTVPCGFVDPITSTPHLCTCASYATIGAEWSILGSDVQGIVHN